MLFFFYFLQSILLHQTENPRLTLRPLWNVRYWQSGLFHILFSMSPKQKKRHGSGCMLEVLAGLGLWAYWSGFFLYLQGIVIIKIKYLGFYTVGLHQLCYFY